MLFEQCTAKCTSTTNIGMTLTTAGPDAVQLVLEVKILWSTVAIGLHSQNMQITTEVGAENVYTGQKLHICFKNF